MSQQLVLQLELARAVFISRHPADSQPRKVLLGRDQMYDLLKAAKEAGYVSPNTIELDAMVGDRRIEFRGLKVYAVDDEQYCEVCS